MGRIFKWLASLSVPIDEATGEPIVRANVGSVELDAVVSEGRASSGLEPKETTDDEPVVLIPADLTRRRTGFEIVNESGEPGSFSVDGGVTWERMIDTASLGGKTVISEQSYFPERPAILVKRVPGGNNLTGLYAREW